MMNSEASVPVRLEDYAPPPFSIDHVELDVDIQADAVVVSAVLRVTRRPEASAETPLRLDGEALETLSVALDGRALGAAEYQLGANALTIDALPERFVLQTRVRLKPDENTALAGLYRSQGGYFTQCEAQGFRRITWFLDRPDVLAHYRVTIHADRNDFPLLLANGHPLAHGDEPGGRHYAVWEDPYKKPCYLFALVAARLDGLHERFSTRSGRAVQLSLYVEPGKLDQCTHAMSALKKAMRWDEERFGLEYDLAHYLLVAVDDFNMGAMENKGLNIFNTKYVLARPDLATDADFESIDRVVAHEYLHNWTGNRVTCRDWFQLSLKEGLTVFRDQEFGADVHDRAVARLREVRTLRATQFPEDAGPMAHPVRPAAYLEINNFYTATVYEKGAEVVRMIQTLIGRAAFRRGLNEYLRRHDGQAATCEDFVAAMAAVSGFDFGQFMRWYSQPGTPRVQAAGHYDSARRRYTLNFSQANPKAGDGEPYLIPIRVALLDAQGEEWPGTAQTLQFTKTTQSFVFEDIAASPVPSLLRDFSAPVILDFAYGDDELAFLFARDTDSFNAWEAGQRLATRQILAAAAELAAGREARGAEVFIEAARDLLVRRAARSAAFVAEALNLPSEATLAEGLAEVDPEALHAARHGLRRRLAEALEGEFRAIFHAEEKPRSAGERALRNLCLAYLVDLAETGSNEFCDAAARQYEAADNMSDRFAALSVLAQTDSSWREWALTDFYGRWQNEALVLDKWFAVQAASRRPDTLAVVRRLAVHPAFRIDNPNKVYALLRTFGANHRHFHAADGEGYHFLAAEIARLDPFNPQVAARLTRSFDRWRKFDRSRQTHAHAALETLARQPGVSRDVSEVVEKLLTGPAAGNG